MTASIDRRQAIQIAAAAALTGLTSRSHACPANADRPIAERPCPRYVDAARGFRLDIPDGWSATPAAYPVMHYRDVFLCVNSAGNKGLRVVEKQEGNTSTYNAETVAEQLEAGTVYLDFAYFEGPGQTGLPGVPDSVGSDLANMLKDIKPALAAGGKLSTLDLSFVKGERRWSVFIYFREPVPEAVRARAWDVLRSFQFTQLSTTLSLGHWCVEFSNGVVQSCEIGKDGSARVEEPHRTSGGKASVQDGAVVIQYDDDRTERWTAVGQRWIVEHWFPSASYPAGPRVLGIAERGE